MDWNFLVIVVVVVGGLFALKRLSFVPAEKARQLLRQGAVVVDVRNPGEFNSGHLPGAINIPLGDLADELPRRLPDKGKALLLHCLSGTRSGFARRQLRSRGYSNAHNLGSYGRAKAIVTGARSQGA
jgi:phage shock protein E